MQETAVSRYAILIGIDHYPDKALKSCVRDVENIRAYLEKETHDPIKIQSITTSAKGQDDNPIAWPTYDNVVSAFQTLTANAKAGDFVYIHYSGHGTRKPASGPFSNGATEHLALVLLGGANNNPRYLWGFELAAELNAMVKKGLIVTLVLDCCFSAGVYRLDPDVRFLPYNPKFDSDQPLSTQPSFEAVPSHSEYRNASMRPSWLIDPKGYTILTACGPHEEAIGLKVDNKNYGALSFYLCNALQLAGLTTRLKELHRHLCAKFQGSGVSQTPALYGNKDQGFFGPATSAPSAAIVPIIKKGNGILHLEAGEAHGISDGDRFVLLPITTDGGDPASQSNSPIAKVVRTRDLTSDMKLEQEDPTINVRTGWMARPLTPSFLRNYPIRLESSLLERDDWLSALETQGLRVCTGARDSPFTFEVTLIRDQYHILDNQGQEIINLPSMPRESTDAEDVSHVLQHLARFKFAKDLSNNASPRAFSEALEVHIRTGDNRREAGALSVVKDGAIVELVVTNKGKKFIYGSVLDLGSQWEVEDITDGILKFPPGCTMEHSIEITLPDELKERGHRSCEEVIKLIFTARPVSFEMLELPILHELSTTEKTRERIGNGSDEIEDWTTANFPIRTVLE